MAADPKKAPEKKSVAAKSLSAKAPKKRTTSEREAEVDANIGESQKLRDFLSGAGWD